VHRRTADGVVVFVSVLALIFATWLMCGEMKFVYDVMVMTMNTVNSNSDPKPTGKVGNVDDWLSLLLLLLGLPLLRRFSSSAGGGGGLHVGVDGKLRFVSRCIVPTLQS